MPQLCETCLGQNPYVRMVKLAYGDKICKISNLPYQGKNIYIHLLYIHTYTYIIFYKSFYLLFILTHYSLCVNTLYSISLESRSKRPI